MYVLIYFSQVSFNSPTLNSPGGGLVCSRLTVKSLGKEGQASSAIPLYEAAVVAASVAVAGVKASVWHEAEPWLWGALLALPRLPSKTLVTEGKGVTNADDDQANASTAGHESDDDDLFFRGSQKYRGTTGVKKSYVAENEVTDWEALANKAAEGSRDWLLRHLLAADTLAFAAR